MAEIMSFLKSIGALPVEWRHLIFCACILLGFLLAYGTPYLLNEKDDADAPKQASPAVQQNITIGVPEAQKTESAARQESAVIPDRAAPSSKADDSSVSTSNIIAPRNIAGGITVHVSGGTNIIQLTGDLSFTQLGYKLTNDTGGEIEIRVYLLFNSAAWSSGSSSNLITYKDKEVTLDVFLDSEKFASDLKRFQAIICLGLASGSGNPEKNIRLSDERAVHLCGRVSNKVEAIKKDITVYGLPLGYNRNAGVKERTQRSVVILGVQSSSGTLTGEFEQRRVISCALKENILNDFKFSDYSEVAPGKLLRYIKINRGIYTQTCDND